LEGDAGTRVRALADEGAGKGRGRGSPRGLPRGRGEGGRVSADAAAVERHLEGVLGLPGLGVAQIRARGLTVALDAVRGAGGVIMPALLERLGCRVVGVNLETDGRFPRAPEPVPEHLGELAALVRGSGADIGMAVDPDVDRLARVAEAGAPIGQDWTRVSEWVAAAPRYAIVKAKLARGTRNAARGLDDVYAALRSRFPEASADMQDGLRLAWRDRWLHVRPSNTEPIIRLIAEAPSGAEAEQLVNEGRLSCAASEATPGPATRPRSR